MDRFGEWRPIPAAGEDDGDEPSAKAPATRVEPARPAANAISVRLIGLLAAGVLGVVGVVLWLSSATARPSLELGGGAAYFEPQGSVSVPPSFDSPTASAMIVIDVEGAVVRPGLHRLPSGSRVGDAIDMAGGYSPQVDIDAAATTLNLAAALTDGAKVHVPARGEDASAVGPALPREPSALEPGAAGGLINVNTATTEELDTLPGIGPVTASKIIAAREAAAFVSVDELLSREVVGASTFEKIRALVSVGL